jgi:hypothetical protein
MQKAVPSAKSVAKSSSRPPRSQSSAVPSQLTHLTALVNDSPRVQAQAKTAEDLQQAPRVAAQQELATEINRGAPAAAQLRKLDEKHPKQAIPKLDKKKPAQPKWMAAAQLKRLDEKRPAQAKKKEEPMQHKKKEEPRQHKMAGEVAQPQEIAQLQDTATTNRTGLPDQLKSGIESLSGISMDNVNVHYNSAKPAQLNALAYAQGTDIHVAAGQERHLPHEAWHVVQQAQGRVQPTMQMNDGALVNDDKGLEQEADVMGSRALGSALQLQRPEKEKLLQGKLDPMQTVQRAVLLLEQDGEDAADDYALQKVLSGFDLANMVILKSGWQADNQAGILPRTEYLVLYSDLNKVKKDAADAREKKDYDELIVEDTEDFYVVGHGGPGMVWTKPNHEGAVHDFSEIVAAIKTMVPEGWTGTIRLLTCNSTVSEKHKSVTEKIANSWGKDRTPAVVGMSGFAYGVGPGAFGSVNKMSVLKPQFSALYKAETYDEDVSKHLLMKAKQNAEKSIELINFNPARKLSEGELKSDVWNAFVEKMKQIEAGLKALVADDGDALGIQHEADPIVKAGVLAADVDWIRLTAEQHALFTHFGLWA